MSKQVSFLFSEVAKSFCHPSDISCLPTACLCVCLSLCLCHSLCVSCLSVGLWLAWGSLSNCRVIFVYLFISLSSLILPVYMRVCLYAHVHFGKKEEADRWMDR